MLKKKEGEIAVFAVFVDWPLFFFFYIFHYANYILSCWSNNLLCYTHIFIVPALFILGYFCIQWHCQEVGDE